MKKNIFIACPELPKIDSYLKKIKQIWQTNQLTNNGNFLKTLEFQLSKYLSVNNILVVSNGSSALDISLNILGFQGEIITTPFSYIATSSSLIWNRCTPIYCDIDLQTFCADPKSIQEKITKNTRGILLTHVFGNVCDLDKISKISSKFKLPLIYDGAHSFGVTLKNNKTIFSYSNATILSFHATKIFHTAEGGAIVFKNYAAYKKAYYMRSYGHKNEYSYKCIGKNAKMSELHAALGIENLKNIDKVILSRKKRSEKYDHYLNKYFDSKKIIKQKINKDINYNYSYYPIVFKSTKILFKVIKELARNNIFPRKYFYPSLNKIRIINNSQICPNSEYIAKRILCLPISRNVNVNDIKKISSIIGNFL